MRTFGNWKSEPFSRVLFFNLPFRSSSLLKMLYSQLHFIYMAQCHKSQILPKGVNSLYNIRPPLSLQFIIVRVLHECMNCTFTILLKSELLLCDLSVLGYCKINTYLTLICLDTLNSLPCVWFFFFLYVLFISLAHLLVFSASQHPELHVHLSRNELHS